MAITQQDQDNLDAAIVSGELTVSFQGRTTTYQSTDAMLKARNHAARLLQQQVQGHQRAPTFGGRRYSLCNFSQD